MARQLAQTTFETGEERGEKQAVRRLLEAWLGPMSETARQRFVLCDHRDFPTRLPGLGSELLDRLDRDLHRVVAEQHTTEHLVFGKLLRFRLDHQHR